MRGLACEGWGGEEGVHKGAREGAPKGVFSGERVGVGCQCWVGLVL